MPLSEPAASVTAPTPSEPANRPPQPATDPPPALEQFRPADSTLPQAGPDSNHTARQARIPQQAPAPEADIASADDPHEPYPDVSGRRPETDTTAGSGSRTNAGDQAAGPGVQQNVPLNLGTVIGVQNNSAIHRLRGTPLPKDWIEELLQPYISDDQTTQAVHDRLTTHRVAVIHAPPGTGRYTTALHALTRRHVTDIRQVRREPGEATDLEGLTDQDTGWILDLRDEEETLRTGFGLHLREARQHLEATGSFVIVVTHTDTWYTVAGEAAGLAHPLTPPDALDVLRAHLTRPEPGVQEPEKWLADGTITREVSGLSPARAAHWARIIRNAVTLNNSTTDPEPFETLVASVVQSARNWRRELLTWHTRNTDSTHRNYLLAAAALDGAPAETIYEAHTTLGAALNDTPRHTAGQQGPGIIELTSTIGADLEVDDRIRFRRPGYAEAVVDYFWVDRPHHAAAFTQWTAEQAASLPREIGTPLADRVTQWATRYTLAKQSFTILRAVTTHWAGSRLDDHARELLVAVAVDPTSGKRARDQYLAWARTPDTKDLTQRKHTPTVLKQALAGALAELGPAYPQIVLKRLSELAAHTTDSAVAAAVGDALTSLWDQPNLQEKIRTTLTSWFHSTQTHHTEAAGRAFLHLAGRAGPDSTPLLLARSDSQLNAWTLDGWRCALDGTPTAALEKAFNTWLDAVLNDPGLQPAVIDTFTQAVFRSDTDRTYLANRYLALHHAANGWEPARAGQQPTERTHLRDTLIIALMEADPAASARPCHAPTTR